MAFVYAAPYIPPSAPGPLFTHMPMTWTGWDGTVWDLCSGVSGLALGAGVRGLNMPPTRRHVTQSPAVAGSRRRGWSTDEREVFWPLRVFRDGQNSDGQVANAQGWVDLDAAFWKSMHPDRAGVWTVESPNGTRSLTCVFDNDGGHATDMIPSLRGWEVYGIYLAAESPYWVGEPVRRSWSQSNPVNFYGPGNNAPMFHISSASNLATATVTNAGDVDAWPVWTIMGPCASVTVGVGGRTVTFPVTIPEGSTLVIDSAPEKRTAKLDGVNVYTQLSSWDFAPVPAGQDRSLSLNMVGAGSVSVDITPRFFRAWGASYGP
jgi:hypothetical protein